MSPPSSFRFFQEDNNIINNDSIGEPKVAQSATSSEIPTLTPEVLVAKKSENRTTVLADGYATFQAQVELAGQIFTIDPVVRQTIFNIFNEFNIIVCGSARVGKSTLINAICDHSLAKTSHCLDSCTKEISRYVLKSTCRVDGESMTYTYNFWDTPGFESWNEKEIRMNVNKIVEKPKSDPLCMIYCASSGSFAKIDQLRWLLKVCITERKIFCALVVTNKWAGQKEQRNAILQIYKELLSSHHEQTSEEDGVFYFGNAALCTMVNAQPYRNDEPVLNYPQTGVDELIEGILSCLDDDGRVFHWCMAVIQKKEMRSTFKGRLRKRTINFRESFNQKIRQEKC